MLIYHLLSIKYAKNKHIMTLCDIDLKLIVSS